MKQAYIKNKWFYWGTLRGVALGIQIDRYAIDIQLLKFYFGVEL